jgi:hypothetical protein
MRHRKVTAGRGPVATDAAKQRDMRRLWTWRMMLLPVSAGAECVATGYLTGAPTPTYRIRSAEPMTILWYEYSQDYPASARLRCVTSDVPCELENFCLVGVDLVEAGQSIGAGDSGKLVLQQPCRDFDVGDTIRLVVYWYCVELFGRDPDFFSTLPFHHAHVTEEERYGDEQ